MNKELIPITKFSLTYDPSKVETRHKIDSIDSAVELLTANINTDKLKHVEMGWVMLFNSNHEILGISELSTGNQFLNTVHLSEILRLALLSNSYHFMVFYNRCNRGLRPEGDEFTRIEELKYFARIVDAELFDVILINDETYFSMLGSALI